MKRIPVKKSKSDANELKLAPKTVRVLDESELKTVTGGQVPTPIKSKRKGC